MRRTSQSLLAGVCFALASAAGADDPPAAKPALPKDGAWVRYFGTGKGELATYDETMTRTYSLVGTKTENGQPCRWVEIKEAVELNAQRYSEVFKFLIPESDLIENEK